MPPADEHEVKALPDSHPILQRLTSQEVKFVTLITRGLSTSAAGKQVGLTPAQSRAWLDLPNIRSALSAARDRVEQHIGFAVTRENLTMMLLEAHGKAGTAMEEIAAIKELGKMHGVYEPEKKVVEHQKITRVEQLRNLSDEELTQLAQLKLDSIDATDAEFTEVAE